MIRCQGQRYISEYQVISPINGRMYQRARGGYLVGCTSPATVRVHVEYGDGAVVEKRVCQACADAWQAAVNQRLAHLKPVWTITPLATTGLESTPAAAGAAVRSVE